MLYPLSYEGGLAELTGGSDPCSCVISFSRTAARRGWTIRLPAIGLLTTTTSEA